MRVLHVIPSLSPVRGGPSEAMVHLAAGLQAEGVDVLVATTDDDGPGKRLDVPTAEPLDWQGIRAVFFAKKQYGVGALDEFLRAPELSTWLRANVKNFDLVHVHALFSWPSSTAMCIARHHGVPYIVRPLGILCQWSLQQAALKKKLFLALYERANLNGARALHCTATLEAREIAPLGLKLPRVAIPLGVPMPAPAGEEERRSARVTLGLPEDEPVLLYLSRWHPKKGLEMLTAVLQELRDHTAFRLILAGRGDAAYESAIREGIERAGLAERTLFPGFVRGAQKEACLRAADLFVLPSHSENFGVAVAEAMAAGVAPVITPGVALAEEVARNGAGWTPERTPEALRASLEEALGNREERGERARRAEHLARESFSWKNACTRLKTLYENVLAGTPLHDTVEETA